MNKTDSTQYKM